MDDRTAYRIAIIAIHEMAKPLAFDANLARQSKPPLPRQQKALEDYERLMQAAALLEDMIVIPSTAAQDAERRLSG